MGFIIMVDTDGDIEFTMSQDEVKHRFMHELFLMSSEEVDYAVDYLTALRDRAAIKVEMNKLELTSFLLELALDAQWFCRILAGAENYEGMML